ncbi:sulfite exporter TauE/SafE family protein [Micromonospora yasonensis]|uniref:HoxN/HupN/NixA family nickel/cobalt transporter n=1 Tax=Micromonospora yasonensis TaxID=1128667 RepID=UPI00222F058F|nr:sulfite exporter TauE/SafE family protein [Micromonospora yasonensis]MCW3839744.1 sulfite exporter TauE/SafE family protein [Micromonospora yasonensis]
MAIAIGVGSPAAAHPLGNFSVNHYHGLHLYPDRIEDLAVLDDAEIPTLQQKASVDRDGDGTVTPAEQTTYANATCREVADALSVRTADRALAWRVTASTFTYRPGAANLATGRTECHLTANVDLRKATTIHIQDSFRPDRVGWHEITAAGHDIGITNSPVQTTSTSDELRKYPNNLLSSPLNQRSVRLQTAGAGAETGAANKVTVPVAGLITRSMGVLGDRLNALTGADRLTPLAGILGVALALLLGAGHAMLPGHGKTVMAAYIAGRRGTYRDALTVGATVTATHTAGVLAVGLLLTTATTLAGETVLGWLGTLSGLLIAGIGASLLAGALTARPRRKEPQELVLAGPAKTEEVVHQHNSSGTHAHGGHGDSHRHDHHSHDHHRHDHHRHRHGRPRTGGLIGVGIANGMLPSPSALIVLLGAVALGRTWFGVMLVFAYGLGMAATLTLAGLLLVRLHRRLTSRLEHRVGNWADRLTTATPILTASLVLAVGVILTLRAAWPLLSQLS